jgi:hypothetical protein
MPAIYQPEPAHGWCYYYQKASLARQRGDWDEISRLYDEATAKGLMANDKSEVFPFLEGLVNAGRYADAKALFEAEIKVREGLSFDICAALAQDPGYPVEFKYDYDQLHQIVCAP